MKPPGRYEYDEKGTPTGCREEHGEVVDDEEILGRSTEHLDMRNVSRLSAHCLEADLKLFGDCCKQIEALFNRCFASLAITDGLYVGEPRAGQLQPSLATVGFYYERRHRCAATCIWPHAE